MKQFFVPRIFGIYKVGIVYDPDLTRVVDETIRTERRSHMTYELIKVKIK